MLNEAEVRERQARALGIDHVSPDAVNREYGAPSYTRTESYSVERQSWNERALGRQQIIGDEPLSQIASPRQGLAGTKPRISWLFDALIEIENLPKDAAASGSVLPDSKVLAFAESIVRLCESEGLSEPILDNREGGAIEIFCREGTKGLLVIVSANKQLQVFGDFSGDTWRARYDLSGTIWQMHLKGFFRELLQEMTSPPTSMFLKI